MVVKIPADKVKELLNQIKTVASAKKVTLKQLQSLCGLLAFCTKALPAGTAFSRQLYMATSKANKPFHFIRVTKNMFEDLMIWKYFLEEFNGITYILDETWLSNYDLQLFSDSSGLAENGCSGYFMGRWFFLQWPKEWENTDILKDMTYLEIIPIALAIYLWNAELFKRRVLLHVDNMAVVAILNKKNQQVHVHLTYLDALYIGL